MKRSGNRLADLVAGCMRLPADCYRLESAGRREVAPERASALGRMADAVISELCGHPGRRDKGDTRTMRDAERWAYVTELSNPSLYDGETAREFSLRRAFAGEYSDLLETVKGLEGRAESMGARYRRLVGHWKDTAAANRALKRQVKALQRKLRKAEYDCECAHFRAGCSDAAYSQLYAGDESRHHCPRQEARGAGVMGETRPEVASPLEPELRLAYYAQKAKEGD